jgi:hypothetical protein
VIGAAAWLGVLNALIPWWFKTPGPDQVYFNAGLTFPGLATFLFLAAAGLTVIARAWIWPKPAHKRDGLVYSVLGIAALVALSFLTRMVDHAWLGYWVGVADAGVLTIAGFARRRERLRGWQ